MSLIPTPTEEATEQEFLEWFYSNADFGPADEDVRHYLRMRFEDETEKRVPKCYRGCEGDEG